ncbi:hypothetical protein [Actinokineospora pegani]|uniref:hypothetical protein n=1 Tax=Actinokineospora pegani TaxID=2654637 RepID=UPI0012E9D111|nr:hypothetical protein [Actinokineospora pegani]
MESTAPVVRDPAPDRPAASDPTTAIILKLRGSQNLGQATLAALVAFVLTSAGLAATLGMSHFFYGHLVAAVLVFAAVGVKYHLWGRWLRARRGPALVAARPWRSLPARVLRARSRHWASVVEVTEDGVATAVRVTALTRAHQAVIARTGRVWVVGPDKAGWAAVRVDGAHEALPARALNRVPASASADAGGGGDVALATARDQRADVLFAVALVLAGYVFVVLAMFTLDGQVGKAMLAAVGGLTGVVLCLAPVLWHTRRNVRLPQLVAGAEWTRVEVGLAPWKARADGTARVVATVRLAGGGTRTLRLASASVELLGTIWDTGEAWLSAEPVPGVLLAVGHPGYPPVSVARVCE